MTVLYEQIYLGNLKVCSLIELYIETSEASETRVCCHHDEKDTNELFYVSLIISKL